MTRRPPGAAPPRHPFWRGLTWLARALYLLLVQSLVGTVAFVLFVYFAVNSPSAAALVSDGLSRALPGTIALSALRWGPSPGHLALRHVRILEPGGRLVIAADSIDAQLDWLRLAYALASGDGPLKLHLRKAKILGADVRLEQDRLGHLLLPMAFADPDQPPDGKIGRQVFVDVDTVQGRDIRFFLDMPEITIKASGGHLDGSFHLKVGGKARPWMGWSAQDIGVADAEVRINAMRQLPAIPPATAHVALAYGSFERVDVTGADLVLGLAGPWFAKTLPDTVLRDARIGVRIAPEVEVHGQSIDLATSSRSAFLGPLLGKTFGARATVRGRFDLTPLNGFTAEGDVRGDGKIAGFETQAVAGHVRLQVGVPGAVAVQIDGRDLDVRAYGGRITAPRIAYRMMQDDQSHHVRGHFTVARVEPGAALRSEGVRLKGLVPEALQGELSGEVGAAVRVQLPTSPTASDVEVDVALETDLSLLRSGPLTPLAQEVPRLHVRGAMVYGMGQDRGPTLDLDDVLLHTAEHAHDAHIEKHEWLRASGHLDLRQRDTRLLLAANVPHLEHVLEPLGILGVKGSLVLEGGQVVGNMDAPRALGDLRLDNLEVRGQRIDAVRARLRLQRGVLALDQLTARSPLGDLTADVAVDLFGETLATPRAHRLLHVHKLNLTHLDLGALASKAGVQNISGSGSIENGNIDVDLAAPLSSLQVEAQIALRGLQAYGWSFPEVDAHVATHGRRIKVSEMTARLSTGDVLHASGGYDLGAGRYEATLDVPSTDLDALQVVRSRGLPLRGSLGGHLEIAGDRKDFALKSLLHIGGLAWDKIEVGDAELALDKQAGAPCVFTSEQFFRHFKLLPGSQATFAHLVPEQVELHIGTDGPIDPFAVAGIERPAGMSVRLDTEVAATLDFRLGHPLYAIKVHVPASGAMVDVGGGMQALRNATPTDVELGPGGITVGSTWLDLGRSPLELCGHYDFGDAATGKQPSLLAFAAGTIDVPRVGVLAQTLAGLDMRLDILSDLTVSIDERSNCLESARQGKGRLRVEGALSDLRIQGAVQTRASRISPRHFGRDVVLAEGGRVEITSGEGGRMSLRIPRTHRLAGTLEEGAFWTWGHIELHNNLPESLDIFLGGTDIPQNSPKEYSMVFSPDLHLTGSDLADSDKRELLLAGIVDVTEGNYFKSFDKLNSLVGNVGERQVESYSRPITETFPWLLDLGLDLRVRGANFDITSRFSLGKADLVSEFNLRIGGTLGDMRIYDRAKIMDASGSQITYSLANVVFDVEQGSLDFNGDPKRPYLDLRLKADIPLRTAPGVARTATGLGQDLTLDTSASTEIVTVFVSITGFWSDDSNNFAIHFSSNKGDSEADVQYLILTGRRPTDTAGGAAPSINTNLLLGEFAADLSKRVLKGLVDTVSIDWDPAGGVDGVASKKVGKNILLSMRVHTGTDKRYAATFAFRISDRLSLNGLWRRQDSSTDTTQSQVIDIYESKLRYRVPLN